jgi:hypothetical protein
MRGVASLTGTLLFQTGDRMLALQYRASRADAAAAVRLAKIALARM